MPRSKDHPYLRREIKVLARQSRKWVGRRNGLRPRPHVVPANIVKPFQDSVFSIPEIQTLIASHLCKTDLRELMLTCRAWFNVCAALIYKDLFFFSYKRTKVYPKVKKYGEFVRYIRASSTNAPGVIHLVEHAPHLRHLELPGASFSKLDWNRILASVTEQLTHLTFISQKHYRKSYPAKVLSSVSRLYNLEHLHWGSSHPDMIIHVDEILQVLTACPRLVSFKMHNLAIACNDRPLHGTSESVVDIPTVDDFAGRQLQTLDINSVVLPDECILRLLGIHKEPTQDFARGGPALRKFTLRGGKSITHRSCLRIFQQCSRLEDVEIRDSRLATYDLFEDDTPWSCAPCIKRLHLAIHPKEFHQEYYRFHCTAERAGVPSLTARQSHQIWTRLRSMIQLQKLTLNGYGLGLAMVEDMSFAKHLQSADIHITLRVPFNQVRSEMEKVVEEAEVWIVKQPHGWKIRSDSGGSYRDGTLCLSFVK
ncbi:hypothetical protein BG004_008444 [Podila humilis]|nr:hypothetical protein BG004_008444 [Podila humilis]